MKAQFVFINSKTIDEETITKANKLLEEIKDKFIIINIPNIKDSKIELLNNINEKQRVLIKIEGGYDKQRLRHDIGNKIIHTYGNIYTINQAKMIANEINNILKRIHKNWTQEQILIYFLNELSTKIIYESKYRHTNDFNIRNLTGLYTIKTVCGGYAMILKELCDQVGIECMYVEGYYGSRKPNITQVNHAWNIVKINDKYYPIDITHDIGEPIYSQRNGLTISFNKAKFLKNYYPGTNEQITDYSILSSLNSTIVKRLIKQASISKEYMGPILRLKRTNNTELIITRCNYLKINNKTIVKYIVSSPTNLKPYIVYSTVDLDTNISVYEEKEELLKEKLRCLLHKNIEGAESIRKELSTIDKTLNSYNLKVLINVILSENNIKESCKDRRGFIGTAIIKDNKIVALAYNKEIVNKLNNKTKTYTRGDGTKFIVEEIYNYDSKLYSYKVYEYISYRLGYKLLENTIYTDYDILKDNNPFLPNNFLSRERIDNKCLNNNGYLGHYTNNYLYAYNKNIINELETRSTISITPKKVLVKKHN